MIVLENNAKNWYYLNRRIADPPINITRKLTDLKCPNNNNSNNNNIKKWDISVYNKIEWYKKVLT
jgi:hypothetical protein